MTPGSTSEDDLQEILNVLNSPTSRLILDAVSEQPMSATEISDSFDIPRSTVYRKLDALCDVSLLERTARLRPDGHHENIYRRDGNVVGIVANQTGVELRDLSKESGEHGADLPGTQAMTGAPPRPVDESTEND